MFRQLVLPKDLYFCRKRRHDDDPENDGDNHDDMAVFRPSTGDWLILRSSDSQTQIVNWGIASDVVSPGDFDGDGKDEPAVFRPSNGNWYANQSTGGFMIANWGTSGDRPIPTAYVPKPAP